MAEFLSQHEIDALLDIPMNIAEELPFYTFIKRNSKYQIIKITLEFLTEKLDMDKNEDIYMTRIEENLKVHNIIMLDSSQSKLTLVRRLKNKVKEHEELVLEIGFIKDLLEKHPEYDL